MLMGACYSQANNGTPWACSGQTQAYRKSLFNRVKGFKHLSNLLQGDDSIFMHICRKNNARIVPALTNNKISKSEFLRIYGHLRPGTYDITINRYDKDNPFLNIIKSSNTLL